MRRLKLNKIKLYFIVQRAILHIPKTSIFIDEVATWAENLLKFLSTGALGRLS